MFPLHEMAVRWRLWGTCSKLKELYMAEEFDCPEPCQPTVLGYSASYL